MRKVTLLFLMLTLVLFLSACSGKDKTVSVFISGDTIPLRYADNLTLVSYPDYTIATLRNPWDTLKTLHTYILVPASQPLPAHLPEGTIVRTPLRKSVIYSSVHCSLMDKLGAAGIAKQANDSGWLKDIEASRLKDDVRNANDYLVLEAKSVDNEKIKAEYDIAKAATEKYKEPLKKYLAKEVSLDSTMVALNGIYAIKEINKEKIRKKIEKFSIEKSS